MEDRTGRDQGRLSCRYSTSSGWTMISVRDALTAGGSSHIQKSIQAATFAEEMRQRIVEARG